MVSRFLIVLSLLAALPALAGPPPYAASPTRSAREMEGAAGWSLFKRPWTSMQSSPEGGGGLGPLFDARSCDSCHTGGGPGRVAQDALGSGLVIRIGRGDGGGDPIYGRQIQTLALAGFDPEADVALHWGETDGLRTAAIDFARLHYGPLAPLTHTALRRAPSLFGVGRLESIPESEILARKGMGRPSWIVGADGTRRLGRFGWKATQPALGSQIEAAFQRDFGISTSGLPGAFGECTEAERLCRAAVGPDVEMPDSFRDSIATFLRLLRSPAPLNEKARGFAMFRKADCLACHAVLKDADGQAVRAYTDLLLHDLGPGLDDGIAEGDAKPSEWRTAPLWNVAGELAQGGLLHDGRARSIAEAVAWHGGEASRARSVFNALSSTNRKLLEDFLLGH